MPETVKSHNKKALIIGAGPAGLTAAVEFLRRTEISPVVFEAGDVVGGISRTANYKGNRIDIGGHRFFSKSNRVMQWWLEMMPVAANPGEEFSITYQQKSIKVRAETPELDADKTDRVMLVRHRKSRIYHRRQFLDYPISLSPDTIIKLGPIRTMQMGVSYLRALLFPVRDERNLEDFLINRFGRKLYETFFREYTEKVWGRPCPEISAAWGAQRIKGLSVKKALAHFFLKVFRRSDDVAQKGTETSLIERFLYPKYGPGQMWETAAEELHAAGCDMHFRKRVERIFVETGPNGGAKICGVEVLEDSTGERQRFDGDYVFSTMPVRDLIEALGEHVPEEVRQVAGGLIYRDFLTVGLLLKKLVVKDQSLPDGGLIKDNWIYIQEPDVDVGRVQVFNNWSPYMVADSSKVWLGLEYFCNEGDALWVLSDEGLIAKGVEELERIGMVAAADFLDGVVIRMPKAYPAYFGSYDRFDVIREFLDSIEGLYPLGRNGMHKYNNQDHSMLSAMVAVDNIIAGRKDKANLWEVNTEAEYHEEKGAA